MNIKDTIILISEGNLYWKNLKGEYLGCNKNFSDLIGLKSPEEIIGKTDRELFLSILGEKHLADLNEIDKQVVLQNRAMVIEEVGPTQKGELAYYLSKKAPLLDEVTGETIGIVGTSIDISEQKQAEKLEAEKKTLHVKTIAATMAHELRTPLMAINLAVMGIKKYLDELITGYDLAEQHNLLGSDVDPNFTRTIPKNLDLINRESNAASAFVEMLLMNINYQKFIGERTECSITDCIEEALARYPFKGKEKKSIRFLKPTPDFKFLGNNLLMVHVFFNLLKNALYFIAARPEGTGEISISVSDNKIYFKDTGTGIAADVLPHIFDQFYSRTYHGTGIGLAYCKMVIEAFSGSITCNSVEGEYTEFTIKLPQL